MTFWQRFKLLIIGIAVAAVAAAVLAAALTLGSILAGGLRIALVAVIVAVTAPVPFAITTSGPQELPVIP